MNQLPRRFLALGLWLVATQLLVAQNYDATPGVPVRLWGTATGAAQTGGEARVEITGNDFLSPSGGTTPLAIAPGTTASTTVSTFSTGTGTAQMEPGKLYTITVNGAFAGGNISNVALNMAPPLGYEIEIDQYRRQRSDVGSTSHIYTVRVLGQRERSFMAAGQSTDLTVGRVYWQVGLGSLRNGGNAGAISIIDPGASADWTVLYTPSALQYEAPSDEIIVIRQVGNVIRQIIANQAVVDINILTGTSYEVKFYHPDQIATGSGFDLRTFNGQPYLSYKVEQGSEAASIKITATSRNVTVANSWTANAARTAVTSLTRVGTWPEVTWTRKDWNTSGAPQVSEQVIVSGGTTQDRTDTLVERANGSSINATYVARGYKRFSWGEEIISSTAGSNNPMTSETEYYDNSVEVGRHGFAKLAKAPGGGWEGFDYWDATSTVGTKRIGTLRHHFRPFSKPTQDTPAEIAFNETQGVVTTYDYEDDPFGWKTRPKLVETRVNNILTASSATTYDEPSNSIADQPIVIATRTDESGSSSLVTITKFFRENAPDFFLRNQIYSVTRPDNVKTSVAYQRGNFNETTKAFVASSTGLGSRIATITGIAGTGYSDYDNFPIDPLALVPGKSTLELIIRDARALVRRTETHAWVATTPQGNCSWQLVSWTNFDYNTFGALTSRVSNNGATYSAEYDGTQLSVEEGEDGVRTEFQYDAAGRVWKAKKKNVANSADLLVTTYAYDASGRMTDTTTSGSGTETISVSRVFDDAGRLTAETPAGMGTTHHDYDIAARTHTVRAPDEATSVTTYHIDGRVKSVTGSGVVPSYYEYSVDEASGQRITLVRRGSATSTRYIKEWRDWLGRVIKTEVPGFKNEQSLVSVTEHFYDKPAVGKGRLWKVTKTGYAPSLYEYDELGQVKRTGLAIGEADSLALDGADRVSEQDRFIEFDGSLWLTTITKTYPKSDNSTAVEIGRSRARLTGFAAGVLAEVKETDAELNTAISKISVNRASKTVTAERALPGVASPESTTTVNGFQTSQTSSDGLTSTFEYDALGRLWKTKNPRHADKTVFTYKTGTGLIEKVTDPAGNEVTTTTYDDNGRVLSTKNADGKFIRYSYNLRGQVERSWGNATYPVEYGYDPVYGDRATMTTYRSADIADTPNWPGLTGGSTTTWETDEATALIWRKKDAADKLTVFDYNLRRQVASREWARTITINGSATPVRTTYDYYDGTGELWKITYNDGAETIPTPNVEYTYTRLGQVETIDQDATKGGIGIVTYHYDTNKPWRLRDESLPAMFGSRVLTQLYEEATSSNGGTWNGYTQGTQAGRGIGFELGVSTNTDRDLQQKWTISNQPRLGGLSVTTNEGTAADFVYSYTANSRLLNGYTRGSFMVTRDYESNRDLVTRIGSSYGAGTGNSVARLDYTYDSVGRRATMKHSGAAYAGFNTGSYSSTYYRYSYNSRNELEGARFYGGDDEALSTNELPGRRFEYSYDGIGNRKSAGSSGTSNGSVDSSGANDDDYSTNELNQYVSRENNRIVVSGNAASSAAVAMLDTMSTTRTDRAWANAIVPDNVAGPAIGQAVIFSAVSGNSTVRKESRLWITAKRQQTFTYDADGNMTGDGLWTYTYNAENRLVRITSALAPGFGAAYGYKRLRLDFRYDSAGRRVEKSVVELDDNDIPVAGSEIKRRYIYQGWNLVAELDGVGTTIQRSYAWGLDLVGHPTVSGGVGALVQITTYSSGVPSANYYPSYDANGNVVALTRGDGTLAAVYEYDPFGQQIRADTYDSAVAGQPFRFSTKFCDEETGLVYFGMRYYSPSLGRFVCRDPKEESGGINIYAFVQNNAVNRWDYLGMYDGFLACGYSGLANELNQMFAQVYAANAARAEAAQQAKIAQGQQIANQTLANWTNGTLGQISNNLLANNLATQGNALTSYQADMAARMYEGASADLSAGISATMDSVQNGRDLAIENAISSVPSTADVPTVPAGSSTPGPIYSPGLGSAESLNTDQSIAWPTGGATTAQESINVDSGGVKVSTVVDLINNTVGLTSELATGGAQELQAAGKFTMNGNVYKAGFYGNQYVNPSSVAAAKSSQAGIARVGQNVARAGALVGGALAIKEVYEGGASNRSLARGYVAGAMTTIALVGGPLGAGAALIYGIGDALGAFDWIYDSYSDSRRFGGPPHP